MKKNRAIPLVVFFFCFLQITGISSLNAQEKPVAETVSSAEEIAFASRIKKISIKGAFPVFKKDIQQVMSLYVGDVFNQEKIKEQDLRIIDFLKKEGYVDPKVFIFVKTDTKDRHRILSVRIEKGPFVKIADVQIEGNQNISSARLKLKAKIWKPYSFLLGGQRLVKKELDRDVKQLLLLYREKGFADAQVAYRMDKSRQDNAVNIVFTVNEGALYTFEFKGNASLSDRTLKKEIAVFKEGNQHGFGIRKSLRNMKKIYTQQGYPDVIITPEVEAIKKEEKVIRKMVFIVNEGPRYMVSAPMFKGNNAIGEGAIHDQMLTGNPAVGKASVYVKKTVEEDLDAIKTLYLNQGYGKTQVEKKVKFSTPHDRGGKPVKQVGVEINIDEGPQTLVGTVSLEGFSHIDGSRALEMLSLKPGAPFLQYMVASDENLLKAVVSEKGYPHVQVKTEVTMDKEGKNANLVFHMDPGPLVSVDRILYAGNFRTSPSVLDNEMTLKPSSPLSLTGLLESRRNLFNMDALDSARFSALGLKEQSSTIDLVIEVQEKKPYYFELEAGYDTRRHLYARSALGDHNFLGRNLNLESGIEVSQIGYTASIFLKEPRFMGSRVYSVTRGVTEKKEEFNKDFGVRSHTVSQEFYRKFFSEKLILGMGGSYSSNELYAVDESELRSQDPEAYEKRGVAVFSPSAVFRTTDSFVRPKKGMLSAANIDISNGIDNDLDDFIKYRLDARWYVTPLDRLTLAVHGRFGLIQPYGNNTTVSDDQLFFLGGTSTVRGFDENLLRYDSADKAVGGKQMVLGSLEARLDLWANFELTAFYDIGSVSQASVVSGSDSFRSSVGCGIRYMTPIGPVGILYGHKLDPRPGESSGSFHFSMGYTF